MLSFNELMEYDALRKEVPNRVWFRAHLNVAKNLELPDRGPKGDPINELRVAMFLHAVVHELHYLIGETTEPTAWERCTNH